MNQEEFNQINELFAKLCKLPCMVETYDESHPISDAQFGFAVNNNALWESEVCKVETPGYVVGYHKGCFLTPVKAKGPEGEDFSCVFFVSPAIYERISEAQRAIGATISP